jgi:hypothetical protein
MWQGVAERARLIGRGIHGIDIRRIERESWAGDRKFQLGAKRFGASLLDRLLNRNGIVAGEQGRKAGLKKFNEATLEV